MEGDLSNPRLKAEEGANWWSVCRSNTIGGIHGKARHFLAVQVPSVSFPLHALHGDGLVLIHHLKKLCFVNLFWHSSFSLLSISFGIL
jgi:hypothetical protein